MTENCVGNYMYILFSCLYYFRYFFLVDISLTLCIINKAFDQHLNLILGDVEETVTTREIDEETDEEIIRVSNDLSCLFNALVFF